MTSKTSFDIALFGTVVSIRLPWLVAIGFTLGISAFELAPDHQIDGRTVIWYINAIVLVGAAMGSILYHEAAHALVSERFGRREDRISLYPLGGVPEDYNDPGTPLREAAIAVAGPISSSILAFVPLLALFVLPIHNSMLRHDFIFLAAMNLVLGIANLLPGYPLDGGRIFRSLVWYLHDDFEVGTRAAVAYGQLISTFALAIGLVIIGTRSSWSVVGFWVILAAWAVTRLGRQEITRSELICAGATVTAGEAVRGLNPHVRADAPLDDVLETLLAEIGSGPALVADRAAEIGVISLNDLRRYRRSDWLRVTAREAMIPLAQLPQIDEAVPIRALLNEFTDERVNTLIVMGQDGVVGVLDRRMAIEKLLARARRARKST